MKLLYIWVKEYKCFNNREFNFSPQYKIHKKVTADKIQLLFTENEKFPKDFYIIGKHRTNGVELISYILGDNGRGKTTLLKLIMDLPYLISMEKPTIDLIAVFEDDEEQFHIYSTVQEVNPRWNKENSNTELKFVCSKSTNDSKLEEIQMIFHTNTLILNKLSLLTYGGDVIDLSINGLLYTDSEYNDKYYKNNQVDNLDIFHTAEMERQIDFVCRNHDKYSKYIPFSIPSECKIKFYSENEVLGKFYVRGNTSKGEKEKLDCVGEDFYNYDGKYKLEELKELKLEELKLIIISLSKAVIRQYNDLYLKSKSSDKFCNYINKGILLSYINLKKSDTVDQHKNGSYQSLIRQIYEFLSDINLNNITIKSSVEFTTMFIKKLNKKNERAEEYCNNLISTIKKLNGFLIENSNVLEKKDGDWCFQCSENKELFKEFYQLYSKTNSSTHYINFDWGLSSGEENFLSLYSRIACMVSRSIWSDKIKKRKSLLFLFDEADLSFHPKWQQEYMYTLTNFLNEFFPQHHIQIIVSTHSPILLSDALKDSVVFLNEEKDEEFEIEETFGANIYDLFRDGMTLGKSNFGIIGKYSRMKIEEVIESLSAFENLVQPASDETLNNIEKVVHCIGEPVIREALEIKLATVKRIDFSAITSNIEVTKQLPQEDVAKLTRFIERERE